MKATQIKVLAFSLLAIYLVLIYFAGRWLGLTGPSLWIFRISLASLGIIGFAGYYFLKFIRGRRGKQKKDPKAEEAEEEVAVVVREAQQRLDAAGLAGSTKIGRLPAVLLLGQSGTAKTTTAIRSGLDPELLSGQAYQDDVVVPTRAVNFWFSRGTVLVDAGGGLLEYEDALNRLLRKIKPSGKSSFFGGKNLAPRAAVVCVDSSVFLGQGAAEKTAALARDLREVLGNVCQRWSVTLPVYVLFTKSDRIPYFSEYVANLTNPEAGLVLGTTLPMREETASGVYTEQQTSRISGALRDLFHSLADKRLEFLPRDQQDARRSAVYQFPREFSKLNPLLTTFLVDLGRPSQLRASPFLRGFYFAGVRAIHVSDVAAEDLAAQRHKAPLLTDATGIFKAGQMVSPEASAAGPSERKLPQWVFLSHLFPDVVLKDTAALAASRTSIKAAVWRRILLGLAVALGLVLMVGWTVSYARNRALRAECLRAVEAMPEESLGEFQLASVEQLQGLERIRVVAAKLLDYRLHGPPLSLRWGLYTGDRIEPWFYRIYFTHFRRLLLASTQRSLVNLLNKPSGVQAMGYRPVYDALKAYLITTSHPDKSTVEFLPPVLSDHWIKGRSIEEERRGLALRQFEFYAAVLPVAPPYSMQPDGQAVATSRAYLAKFAAVETIYQAMLDNANQQFPTIRFNEMFPGSDLVVRNTYPVAGAFTKNGWEFMKKAIGDPGDYFAGEQWVMGEQAFAHIDMAKLPELLEQRYRSDFLKTWREFLKQTRVVGYSSIPDAARKLERTSNIQSPLLALMCVVSQNTAVEDEAVSQVFQPAQFVTPEGCQEKLTGESNAGYMDGLIQLQAALQQLADNAGNEMQRSQAISAATAARVTTRQMGQNFRIDKEGRTHAMVQKLLDDPITYAQNALLGAPVEAINAAGKSFCTEFRPLLAKYPFQPKAKRQANLAEVNGIFQPGAGSLWRLYEEHVGPLLVRQGARYAPKPGGPIGVTGDYQSFFSRMAAVSDAFYSGGSTMPNLTFSIRPVLTPGIEGVTLTINGTTVSSQGPQQGAWQFAWPGAGPQEARLSVKLAGGSELAYFNFSGLWAVFEMLATADRWGTQGAQSVVEWRLRTSVGDVISPQTNRPVTVRLLLDMQGAPPVFRPGYLSTLRCVSRVARRR